MIRPLDLLASISYYFLVAVAFPVVAIALTVVIKSSQASQLDGIPTVGSSTWLGSCWAGLRYFNNAIGVIQEGYERHKTRPFKVAESNRWIVIVGDHKHVEEVVKAPHDTLSFEEASNDMIQAEHTVGSHVPHNPHHIQIVRTHLTRNIGALLPEIKDEIIVTFEDVLNLIESEWKSVPAFSTVQTAVCRTSNRMFVGLPLCRDPDWINLNIQFTLDLLKGATIIGHFPDLLKPLASRFFTNITQNNVLGRKLLGPIIEERKRDRNEYGEESSDKPNDFLSWMMEEAEDLELTTELLTVQILLANFAAIHSVSYSFTHVLLYLAANPRYIKPLREEVEWIVEKEGWTRLALGKMRKVDSFIKECQRLEGVTSLSLSRKALKDFTFSDGVFIPKGTTIAAATRSIHLDEAFYENARAFEPFRFADMREVDGEGIKHSYVSTAIDYLPFGLGRHACPGRFFVGAEMKIMLAHLVTTYDIKMAGSATLPPPLHFGTAVIPDRNAKVMFRRRVD